MAPFHTTSIELFQSSSEAALSFDKSAASVAAMFVETAPGGSTTCRLGRLHAHWLKAQKLQAHSSSAIFHSTFKIRLKISTRLFDPCCALVDTSHSLLVCDALSTCPVATQFWGPWWMRYKNRKASTIKPCTKPVLASFSSNPLVAVLWAYHHPGQRGQQENFRSGITQNSGHIIVSISLLPLFDIILKLDLSFLGQRWPLLLSFCAPASNARFFQCLRMGLTSTGLASPGGGEGFGVWAWWHHFGQYEQQNLIDS